MGAWAAAFRAQGSGGDAVDVAGVLRGMDQSAMAAELEALLVTLRALRAAGRSSAIIVVDNLNVVRGANAGRLDGTRGAAWREVARLLQALPGVEIHWVPSHGKHKWWRPVQPYDGEEWRTINDVADAAAQDCANQRLLMLLPAHQTREAVVRRTDRALAVQSMTQRRYWEFHQTGEDLQGASTPEGPGVVQ